MKKEKAKTKKPKALSLTEILQEKSAHLAKEVTEYKQKYLSALADSENMRKRLQKEKIEFMQFAKRDLVCEILAPLDSFATALHHAQKMSSDVKNWALGFQMILNQLEEILQNHEVRSFDSKGELFDPNKHEALEMVESDQYPPGIIIEECAKGYMIGPSLLRCAKVKVAKAKAETTSKDQNKKTLRSNNYD